MASGEGGHVLVAPAPLARTTRGRRLAPTVAPTVAVEASTIGDTPAASIGVARRVELAVGVAPQAIGAAARGAVTADNAAAIAAIVAPTASPTVGVSQLLRA